MFLKSLSSVGALLPPFAATVSPSRATAAVRDQALPQQVAPQPFAATQTASISDLLELSPEAEALLEAPPLAGSQQTNASDAQAIDSSLGDLEVGRNSDEPLAEPGQNSPRSRESQSSSSKSTAEAKPESEAGASDQAGASDEAQNAAVEELTPEEQEQVQKLSDRDREVRTHEQAHVAVAGPYARGGPTYTYQKGPDGRRYAIGGEVQIDTAPVSGDPEATIRKAQVVRAAALAPAEPSSQDRAVAAAATKMQQQAQAELAQQRQQVNAGEDQGAAESEIVIADSDATPEADANADSTANTSTTSTEDRTTASKSRNPANGVGIANNRRSNSLAASQTPRNAAQASPYGRVLTASSVDLWA